MSILEKSDRKMESGYALLTPLQFGPFKLSHRVVMGPLTRCRCQGSIPHPHAALYYSQRATQGGLMLTEAVGISPTSKGYPAAPGIWTQEQVEAWKPVVSAIHEKGGFLFCQLSHVGRRSHTSFQPNSGKPISSTSRQIKNGNLMADDGSLQDFSVPRALETQELQGVIADYVSAAKNAIAAGFDGVEIHGANGYLLDQFLRGSINDRSDEYGGSAANRAKLLLEVTQAVADEIGKDLVGVKLSPFSDFGDAHDSDPTGLGVYVAEQLSRIGVLYATFVEARVQEAGFDETRTESVWPFRKAFRGFFLAGGGYDRDEGIEAIESGKADAVIYARLFLANPDLPRRFALNAELNEANPATFFSTDPVAGYTDYPFLEDGSDRDVSF